MELAEFETMLKRDPKIRGVERVVSMEKSPAVGKGENYTCLMTRVKLEVVLGSGRRAKRSIILKETADAEGAQMIMKEFALFKAETMMYTVVLPQMEKLMDDYGDKNDVLWCRCYGHTPYSLLVLEDLTSLGFTNADRIAGLDFAHSKLLVRSLGRFHGMSRVLVDKGLIDIETIRPNPFASNAPLMKNMSDSGISTLVKIIREDWGPEWSTVADKMKALALTLPSDMQALGQSVTEFKVLNHGDCWTNNFMFKYSRDIDGPIGVKFVDFQVPHYSSYIWDVTYFVSTSLRLEEQETKTGHLLEAYRSALLETLEFYGCSTEDVPSLETMHIHLDQMHRFKLWVVCVVMPVTMADSDDAMDLEKVVLEQIPGETTGHNADVYRSPHISNILKSLLKSLVKKGQL